MSHGGRPLRFVAMVLGLWIGARVYLLWPGPPPAPPTHHATRTLVALPVRIATVVPRPPRRVSIVAPVARFAAPVPPIHTVAVTSPPPVAARPPPPAAAPADMPRYGTPAPPSSVPTPTRRWSASGWALVRGVGAGGGVATPQLGGSQASLRIARTLDVHGRVAIVARVAAAIDTRQQEAAIGLEWRPTALPVRIVAERRIGIADIRGGTGLGLVGGVSERALPAGFRLDGYAQAGAIVRDGVEGYADGALRIARPVLDTAGVTLALGVGAWGAIQRDARRVDAGPSATLTVPIAGTPRLRVALEWRQRLAGAARPASGPTVSIGTDY